jgi:hypothetical protein
LSGIKDYSEEFLAVLAGNFSGLEASVYKYIYFYMDHKVGIPPSHGETHNHEPLASLSNVTKGG